MDESLRKELTDLFATVERGPLRGGDLKHPYRVLALNPDEALIFRSNAVRRIREISKKLAQPSAEQGWSVEGVDHLVEGACRKAIEDSTAEAISWFESELRRPPRQWFVAEGLQVRFTGDTLLLGKCQLNQRLAPDYANEALLAEELSGTAMTVVVTSNDEHGARRQARDFIDEAGAIVVMADGRYLGADLMIPHLIGEVDQIPGYRSGLSKWLDISHVQDRDDNLYPEYRALSEVAAKHEEERTDWERRSLASVRWYARAVTTSWPSEALSAAMIALESLFIRDRKERPKGKRIAERASAHWRFHENQESWLGNLYSSRNEVTHEGRYFVEEVDLYDLLALVGRAVHWAAWHLHDMHRSDGERCISFDEAMSPHS